MGSDITLAQVALTTGDLPASLRFYAETFGFANAGGIPIWGEPMRLQGLDPSARALMWWLTNEQRFFQLELFAYTNPVSQPRPSDWRPCDHGWVRFGIGVSEIDAVRQVLARWGVAVKGEHTDPDGTRRIAFVDPFATALIEVIERTHVTATEVLYATYSTADLDASRHFYSSVLGLPIAPLATLHRPAHEAMWGLEGADVDGFVVLAQLPQIEVVCYGNPVGRKKPARAGINDLGIMNVALGARDSKVIGDAIGRVQKAGIATTPVYEDGGSMVTYLTEPGTEIELIAMPEIMDGNWGFRPIAPFLGLGS